MLTQRALDLSLCLFIWISISQGELVVDGSCVAFIIFQRLLIGMYQGAKFLGVV